jgi:hypothetical protein
MFVLEFAPLSMECSHLLHYLGRNLANSTQFTLFLAWMFASAEVHCSSYINVMEMILLCTCAVATLHATLLRAELLMARMPGMVSQLVRYHALVSTAGQ